MFISRRAIILDDGLRWVFWCSCDKARGSLVSSLSHHVKACYEELCKDECLHIAAARCIIEQIDAVHAISPDIDFCGRCSDPFAIAVLCIANSHHADHDYHVRAPLDASTLEQEVSFTIGNSTTCKHAPSIIYK